MNNYKFICEISERMGKKKQDIANWKFTGKVPNAIRFDMYCKAKKEDGIELTEKDFENFKE